MYSAAGALAYEASHDGAGRIQPGIAGDFRRLKWNRWSFLEYLFYELSQVATPLKQDTAEQSESDWLHPRAPSMSATVVNLSRGRPRAAPRSRSI